MSALDAEIAEGLAVSLRRELARAALELAILPHEIRIEVSFSEEAGRFVWLAFDRNIDRPAGWGTDPIMALRDLVHAAGLCGAKVSGDSRRPCTRPRGHRGRHNRG